MSIDLYLEIETGNDHWQRVINVGNYTHNCQPMWTKALQAAGADFGVCQMTGMNAGEVEPLLKRAVDHLDDSANEEAYFALNPPNGWGEFRSAREYLRKFWRACQENPRCRIEVSC